MICTFEALARATVGEVFPLVALESVAEHFERAFAFKVKWRDVQFLLAGELAVAFGGVRIGGHDTQFLSNFRADFLIVLLSSVDFIGLGRTVAPLKVLPVSS